MNKLKILEGFIELTEASLETMTKAAHHARDSAISDEVKTQDKYDTQSTELAYLAGAQAERALQLKTALGRLRLLEKTIEETRAGVIEGSLFYLENLQTHTKTHFMLLPIEGGIKVENDGIQVTSLSSAGPLGQELLGYGEGDSVELEMNGKDVAYTILKLY